MSEATCVRCESPLEAGDLRCAVCGDVPEQSRPQVVSEDLEQTVLRVHITQRSVGIFLVGRIDMRHAPGVVKHRYRPLQALQLQLTFALCLS